MGELIFAFSLPTPDALLLCGLDTLLAHSARGVSPSGLRERVSAFGLPASRALWLLFMDALLADPLLGMAPSTLRKLVFTLCLLTPDALLQVKAINTHTRRKS